MKLLKELLISVAIVAVFFLLVGIVLPSHRHLSETIDTNRRPTLVYDTVNSFGRWKDWNSVTAHDPRAQLKISGPASGVGAQIDYTGGNGVGKGSWKITGGQSNQSVDFAINNDDMGSNKKATISIKPDKSEKNTTLIQTYDVDYGFNLLGRYAGLYASSYAGEDMKINLRRLTGLLAEVPNLAYDQMTPPLTNTKFVELAASDVITINSGTVINDFAHVYDSVKNNYQWLKRVMDANGLEPAGPFYLVTEDVNIANYGYNLVQPVKKKGSTATTGLTNVALQGTVKFATIPARKAVMTSVSATDYNAMSLTRDALRAWALVHGYQIADKSFEVYKDGVDKSFTAGAASFDVYWPVK
ncbi:MAG: SRPBCC family protein [Xanthomonadales bacterium]|nr:SRPBCC family protein [Xanthomonadales bacterium]